MTTNRDASEEEDGIPLLSSRIRDVPQASSVSPTTLAYSSLLKRFLRPVAFCILVVSLLFLLWGDGRRRIATEDVTIKTPSSNPGEAGFDIVTEIPVAGSDDEAKPSSEQYPVDKDDVSEDAEDTSKNDSSEDESQLELEQSENGAEDTSHTKPSKDNSQPESKQTVTKEESPSSEEAPEDESEQSEDGAEDTPQNERSEDDSQPESKQTVTKEESPSSEEASEDESEQSEDGVEATSQNEPSKDDSQTESKQTVTKEESPSFEEASEDESQLELEQSENGAEATSQKEPSEDDSQPGSKQTVTKEESPSSEETLKGETEPDEKSFATVEDMAKSFSAAKQALLKKLQADYGAETFHAMFMQDDKNSTRNTRARAVFVSPNPENNNGGWKGIQRKLSIKLLKVLASGQQQQRRRLGGPSSSPSSWQRIPFVWATGGHSAAAAHGNYFNQSYTAYMEHALKDVFASVGMDFVGRNYGVGGQNSAPEVAGCISSIFGNDFDILSWDYGMTDGDHWSSLEMYFYRAGIGKNRPSAVVFPRGDNKYRMAVMAELDDKGLPSLVCDSKGFELMLSHVPDTLGMSQKEIDAMPPFTRNFKCDGQIEDGDPYCSDEKYTLDVCPDRKGRVSWHPGWKWHAMNGNLMALLMVELLEDALRDISSGQSDVMILLRDSEALDIAQHQQFIESALPTYSVDYLLNETQAEEIRQILYRSPSFCHTGLLPAQIRYKGVLTGSPPIDPKSLEVVSLTVGQAVKKASDSEELKLVFDEDTRHGCEVQLDMDHRDFFYVNAEEGWKKLRLPTEEEMEEYGGNDEPLKGLIAVCYVGCPWGHCPEGNIVGGIEEDDVKMEVNGVPVESLVEIGKDGSGKNSGRNCFLFRSHAGLIWEPNSDGRLVIRTRVTEPGNYVRFSSLIVW